MGSSLGVLTLDIVAKIGGFTGPLDEAGRKTKKFSKAVEEGYDTIKTSAALAGAAVVASLTAMTVSTVQAAGEIQRFAAVAGTSNAEFQKYAAAAKVVGIQTDKMGDIFKDVNDKVGDFLQTGGGELKDFFTNIAPKVGVTADQFRKLSGPQALELFVSTLEKAGASQKEFTFYLEGIADDASLLLPLLKNGAEGFHTLGAAAESAGGIMSDKTISAASQLSAAMWSFQQTTKGASSQIVGGMLPALVGVSGALSEASIEGGIFAKTGETLGTIITGAADVSIRAATAVHNLGSSIGALAAAGAAVMSGEFKQAKFIMDEVTKDNKQATEDAEKAISRLYEGTGKGAEQLKLIASFMDEAKRSAKGLGAQVDLNAGKNLQALKAVNAVLNEQNKLLEESTEVLSGIGMLPELAPARGFLNAPSGITKDWNPGVWRLLGGPSKPAGRNFSLTGAFESTGFGGNGTEGAALDPTAAAEMLKGMTAAPSFGGVDGDVGGAFGELAKIDDAQDKLSEWYNAQLEMLDEFRRERADLNATWDATEQDLDKRHQAELLRIEQARQSMQLQAASSVFADLAGMTKAFGGEQSAAYKAMFAVSKAFAIADSIVQISNGIAKASNNPWPVNLGAMASVAAATMGIVSSIQSVAMVGMAHDGIDSVPNDGTWLLQKGERVTTAETSAKLDKTLDNVQKSQGGGGATVNLNLYEDKSKAGTFERREENGKTMIDVWVADLMGDGKAQKAMSRKFGLQPVGS